MDNARRLILDSDASPDIESIIANTADIAANVGKSPLKPVINATGIVLHTNLGRAPLGANVIDEIVSVARGIPTSNSTWTAPSGAAETLTFGKY